MKISTTNNEINGVYFSKEFEYKNSELRQQFDLANREIEKVKQKTNELVEIVHNDNPKWSIKKICDYIAGCNDDLEEFGFSSKTIYNYLSEKSRQIIDARRSEARNSRKSKYQPSSALEKLRQEKGETELQNNVTDSFVETFQQKDIENSSITPVSSNVSNVGVEQEGEEEEVSQEYQDKVWKLERRITELEESFTPFEVKHTVTVKDQELPFIIKVDPRKRIITSLELYQREVKKLNRF